jgi:hypothetical protein
MASQLQRMLSLIKVRVKTLTKLNCITFTESWILDHEHLSLSSTHFVTNMLCHVRRFKLSCLQVIWFKEGILCMLYGVLYTFHFSTNCLVSAVYL